IYLGPKISVRSLGGKDEISFIDAEGLMHAARSYIGNHASQAWGKLLLNVEVPLHDVIAFGVLDIGRAKRICGESDILTREVEKGTRAGIVDRGIRKEGCCLSAKEYELIRQREDVE